MKLEQLDMGQISLLHEKRNQLMRQMVEKGIAVRQGTHAVHTLGYYKKKYRIAPEDYKNSWIAENLSVTLPLYAQMTDDEQDYVIQELKKCAVLLEY